jgi:CheY-like chemotaxis protein
VATGRRILVVDDDRVTLTWATRTLQKAGYAVVSALDAEQAVMQAHREAPELIVTDLGMPAGGGFSVLERLAMSTRTSAIPVVILTGSADTVTEARARELGVAGFLRKPSPPEALLRAVAAALGQEEGQSR